MRDKKLSVNLSVNILSYGISTILSFLITPFIVNHLGKEVYGFYGIANSFVNYITVIATALNSMAAKYITVEKVRGNLLKANQYYTSILFSNVLLCVILTPILAITVFNLQTILQISDEYLLDVQALFCLIFAAMLLRFSTSVYGTATYITNRMDLKAYIDMAKSIVRLLLYLLLFAFFKPSVIYLGVVIFFLESFNSVVQIFLAHKLIPDLSVERKFFNGGLIVGTLRVGVWNSFNQLGDLMLSSSDLIMANILLGESASGNISIIKTLPSLISGIITAINAVFMPRIAIVYAMNDTEKLVAEVKRAQKILGMFVTPVVVILMVFGPDFYKLWVPNNDYILLGKLSTIDVCRMMLIAVVWPVSNLNIVLDRVKLPSLLVIGSGICNIAMMAILTKFTDMGIFSIVVTTLVLTIAFYGGFIPTYPCGLLNIKWNTFVGPIFQMIGCALLTGAVVVPLHNSVKIDTWFDFISMGCVCGIVALLISAFTFVGKRNISKILHGVHM